MSRSVFGWDYPPGAANDPNAPWNQEDPPEECPMCGQPNSDEEGNPVFDEDPIFCSRVCLEKYERQCEQDDERLARYEEDLDEDW